MLKTTLCLIFPCFVFAIACKKKNTCVAGPDGGLELVLVPQHHTKPILSQNAYPDTAYIRFNSQDAPASLSDYDVVIAGVAGEEHIHVPDMKCGSYYIFCTAFDTSIHQRVKGGIPYTTGQSTGEVDINVPVSEE